MRINPLIYGGLVLAVFFSVILGFQAAGAWSVSGMVTANGEAVQPSADNIDSIKGWMTLEQVTHTFNVPLAELLKQFELPANTPPTTALKDLESPLFSVTNLKSWLQEREQATPGLALATATPAYATAQAAQPVEAASPAETIILTPAPTSHVASDRTVTGKTTFQDLLDWGVSAETIQKITGTDLPTPSTVIKDFINANGLDFPTVKPLLQDEVNRAQ